MDNRLPRISVNQGEDEGGFQSRVDLVMESVDPSPVETMSAAPSQQKIGIGASKSRKTSLFHGGGSRKFSLFPGNAPDETTDHGYDEHGRRIQKVKGPTYRMEPKPEERYSFAAVKRAITSMFDKRLKGVSYERVKCATLSKYLSEQLRADVRALGFSSRYRYVCLVTIGQNIYKHSLMMTSRACWDTMQDTFVTATWKGNDIFAVGTVYIVYKE